MRNRQKEESEPISLGIIEEGIRTELLSSVKTTEVQNQFVYPRKDVLLTQGHQSSESFARRKRSYRRVIDTSSLQMLEDKRDMFYLLSLIVHNTKPVGHQDLVGLVISMLLLGDFSLVLLTFLLLYSISFLDVFLVLFILPLGILLPFPAGINALFSHGPRRSAGLARFYALWNLTSLINVATMGEPTQLIPEITPETKDWAVRVTIMEDIPSMTCSNGAKLKRYILADKKGNEVVCTVYGRDVPLLCPMIDLHGVYDISNAEVTTVPTQFQVLRRPIQWIIKRETPIRPVPQAEPNLQYFLGSLTPFSLISANIMDSKTADIMGIVIGCDEVKQVNNGQNSVQHFTIIDEEKLPLSISIWDETLEAMSKMLVEAANTNAVVVAKRLAIKTYNCISLSSRNSSSFTINPPVQAAANLKAWFNALSKEERQQLLINKTVSNTRELVMIGKLKTYTIAEVTNETQAGDYWVRGNLKLLDENQKFYYVACPTCQNKIKRDPYVKYTCFICKAEVVATLRLLMVLVAYDETSTTKVIAVDQVAEHILQTTAQEMSKSIGLGAKLDLESIKHAVENKNFLMLLRRNYARNTDTHRNLMLISLHDSSDLQTGTSSDIGGYRMQKNTSPSESVNKGKEPESPISPLKRQMSQIMLTSERKPKKLVFASEHSEPDCHTSEFKTNADI